MVRVCRKILKYAYTNLIKENIGTITHVITHKPLVALTFDDGPDIETTPGILEVLEKNNARGTFFLVGENAHQNSELVCRMAKTGHAVGNHSWDHPSFPIISCAERRKQMRLCEKTISSYSQKLFRPPYGDQSYASRLDAFLMGFKVVTWNLLAEDWKNVEPGEMVKRLSRQIQPGSIVLFHDTLHTVSDEKPSDNNLTLRALEMLLPNLANKFQFVALPELLNQGIPFYAKWFQKPNADYLNKLQGTRGRRIRRYSKTDRSHWKWE